jgi:hypothetical protein
VRPGILEPRANEALDALSGVDVLAYRHLIAGPAFELAAIPT